MPQSYRHKNKEMNNYIKSITLTLLLAVCTATSALAQSTKQKTIYAFAYGTNLKDSTAYISAVATLRGVDVENKTDFLTARSEYSKQIKHYLEQKYGGLFTCAVIFGEKKDKVEKRYVKIRKQASSKKSDIRLIEIPQTDFSLQAITFTAQP